MARNCRKVRCGVVAPGRKTVAARDPGLVPALKRLLEPATLGDPMRPLLWVSKSMDKLAAILTAMGHPIGADTVRRELVKLGFSRQYNRKALRRYECGDPLTRHCGEAGHPFGERRLAPHQSRAAACSPLSSCNRFRLGRRPFRFRNANKILHRRFLRRALGRFNTVTSYAVAHGGDFARMRNSERSAEGRAGEPRHGRRHYHDETGGGRRADRFYFSQRIFEGVAEIYGEQDRWPDENSGPGAPATASRESLSEPTECSDGKAKSSCQAR